MNHWLDALVQQTTAAVLVTVAKVAGSAPREPGAKMLVTPETSFDTIGGGHLEMRAIEIARTMLTMPSATLASERRLEYFSLGPSLGQCCGGTVHLAFERMDNKDLPYINRLNLLRKNQQDYWRLVALETRDKPTLFDATGKRLAGPEVSGQLASQLQQCVASQIILDDAGQRWLLDACLAHQHQLMLFGAGHVGAAIVRALADLPCSITWVDEREDVFPAVLPANVRLEITDTPEALIGSAPPACSFLVLTHSHALDQRLAEHILRRAGYTWFGLIGSKTKRMQFEHRLRERGISAQCLAQMVCPIGLPGIDGKEPAIIAASVAAQLLQVWQQAAHRHPTNFQ